MELTDIGSHAGSRVHRYDDSLLEDEGQGGCAMGWLHHLHCLPFEGSNLDADWKRQCISGRMAMLRALKSRDDTSLTL